MTTPYEDILKEAAGRPFAAIVGWPVAQSRSPALHGYWLKKNGIAGYYGRLPVEPKGDNLKDLVAFIRKTLGKPSQVTAHQVHAPEIALDSPSTARGVWALNDVVRLAPGINLNGYGHYHETYAKVDGQWVITTSTLTRLREDVF